MKIALVTPRNSACGNPPMEIKEISEKRFQKDSAVLSLSTIDPYFYIISSLGNMGL